MTVIHTISDESCTTCGETEEWLTHQSDAPEFPRDRIIWDTRIYGAWVTLVAQNPRTVLSNSFAPEQGTLTEWDLTDGDDTPYGTVRSRETDSDLAIHRRMASLARTYWAS